jgi:sarcosine oxidase
MRIVVVGGGVIGLLTAVECVRAGARVDLVDQASIPAPLATSNDRYRVVRALHRGDRALTMAGALGCHGWAEVERWLDGRFWRRTGALTVMPPDDVPASLDLLAEAGAAGRAVPAAVLTEEYPQLCLVGDRGAVYEPGAGVVLAADALAALAGWLAGQPAAALRPGHRVTALDENGAVHLADGSVLAADAVVAAPGPWARDLVPADAGGRLTLLRQTMLSYTPDPSSRAWTGLPAVLGMGRCSDAWLMPAAAGPSVRLSAASACRPVSALAGRTTPARWRDHLVSRFSVLLADFDPARVTGAADSYYLSDLSGLGPRLARLGSGAVWVYPACGGMSFKIAPLVAGALADRVLGRPPRHTGLDSIDRPWPLDGRAREGRHDEAART